mmetsp:Transcript_10360/g.23688  ORF Transcript_10360/g.23688 Transcript_10360/m.23688 type:complete len:265 (-) Transcript_10360:317-1111(-)
MQAHEPRPKLNDPNASLHTARGQQHTMNRVHGSLYHGVETNALVNVRKVVLDGFGDQNHAQFHLSLDSPELNIRCALARLNIPKNIKLINSSFLQHIEGFFHVARVCRVSQDGASFLVDVSHSLLRELQPFLGGTVRKPSPSKPHPPCSPNIVGKVQTSDNLAHNDVDARIKSTTGYDRGVHFRGGEVRLLAWTSSHPLAVHQSFALCPQRIAKHSVSHSFVDAHEIRVDRPRPREQRILILLKVGQVALQLHHFIHNERFGDL